MTVRPAIFITGGAIRVGAAICRYFAEKGYDIGLHYHSSEQDAKKLQKEIEALGVSCLLFRQDLAHIGELPVLIENVQKSLPHCVALVNNASVFERCEFGQTDEALYDRQMGVNLKVPFFLSQAYVKTFRSGSIINLLDTDIVKHNGSHFAYLLSKKALAEFTMMAARNLGPQFRVNAVCPGCILPSNQNDEAYEKKVEALIPLKSNPDTLDISETVYWLVQQRHITGQLVFVDGGKHVL